MLILYNVYIVVEFGYEEFQLTKAEVVYYYERLSVTGICLVFLEEFVKELPINNEYSLVRLTRPSEVDINSANELRCRSEKRAAELDTFARGLLTKPVEHVAEGTEVVARQGLAGISNLQSNREKLAIDNVILNHSNNKRQRSTADDDAITNNCDGLEGGATTFSEDTALEYKSLKELRAIGKAEGVTFNGATPRKKQAHIAAIIANRSRRNIGGA